MSVDTLDSVEQLRALVEEAGRAVNQRRALQQQWVDLESSNATLRARAAELLSERETRDPSLASLLQLKGAGSSATGLSCVDGVAQRQRVHLLQRAQCFVSACSSAMRTDVWKLQRELDSQAIASSAPAASTELSSTDAASDQSDAETQQPLASVQVEQLRWLLDTLPHCVPDGSRMTDTPLAPLASLPPTTLPPLPLEWLTREWRTLFPSQAFTADNAGIFPEGVEALLQETWDSLQASRPLWDESGGASSAAAGSQSERVDPLVQAQWRWGFPSAAAPAAYEFDEPDEAHNIVFEGDAGGGDKAAASSQSSTPSSAPAIKCASLSKLVERLTHESYVDLNLRYVFLLTYRSFTTPLVLLSKLRARFFMPLPPNLSPEELARFQSARVDRVRIRVASVLKYWVDEHWEDFSDDTPLREALEAMLGDMRCLPGAVAGQLHRSLVGMVGKKERAWKQTMQRYASARVAQGRLDPGLLQRPSLSRSLSSSSAAASLPAPPALDLLSIDSDELARQLTLLAFDRFVRIRPRECLNQSWHVRKGSSGEVLPSQAPNIVALIDQFNALGRWAQSAVLRESSVKARARLIERLVRVADHCRAVNNFNSAYALVCALTSNALHRLRATWELVPSRARDSFDALRDLFKPDKNSRSARAAVQSALLPCIPHIGLFLQDLTFIEDGNPDRVGSMINWTKRGRLAERIGWIKQFQQEAYAIEPNAAVLRELQSALDEAANIDDEQLWQRSREVEPPASAAAAAASPGR